MLETLGNGGLGALSFQSSQNRLKTDSSADIKNLGTLLETALRYDSGLPVPEFEIRTLGKRKVLLWSGASTGGLNL